MSTDSGLGTAPHASCVLAHLVHNNPLLYNHFLWVKLLFKNKYVFIYIKVKYSTSPSTVISFPLLAFNTDYSNIWMEG